MTMTMSVRLELIKFGILVIFPVVFAYYTSRDSFILEARKRSMKWTPESIGRVDSTEKIATEVIDKSTS
jgi:hypothetical protein